MGGELWGTYDEREAARSFKDAVREWRGGGETSSSASSLSVAYATSASNAALRPSEAGWGHAPQYCWECLARFTDRGHWSVLARRQFCGKACATTYEKARRLEPPPSAPPRRRAACQRCFNLCDPDAAVPAAGGGVFCAAACAVAAGAATPAPPSAPAPPSGAPRGRAPRAKIQTGGATAATSAAAATTTGRGSRACAECGGPVDLLRGAVGVVIAGLGSRMCCGRACAEAAMARPSPEDEGSAGESVKTRDGDGGG